MGLCQGFITRRSMKREAKREGLEVENLLLCRQARNFVERRWYIATACTTNRRVFVELKWSESTVNVLLVSLDVIFVSLDIVLRSKMYE